MEKQTVIVSYKNSGVKALKVVGYVLHILAIISFFVTFVYAIMAFDTARSNSAANLFIVSLGVTISLTVTGHICNALSTIARTALYKRCLLEQQYNFEKK